MLYMAEYENEGFVIFRGNSDDEALTEAWSMERENGLLFNLMEINDDYEEIRTIL